MDDNYSIGDYDLYDCVFEFAFLNKFFSNETENNTSENKIYRSWFSACNTLDVVKHFDDNQPLQAHIRQLEAKVRSEGRDIELRKKVVQYPFI